VKRVLLFAVLLAAGMISGCSSMWREANVTRDQWEPPVAESDDGKSLK